MVPPNRMGDRKGCAEMVPPNRMCDRKGCAEMVIVDTLGPAYNEYFNAQRSASSKRVLLVTELFNIVVNDRLLTQQKFICS